MIDHSKMGLRALFFSALIIISTPALAFAQEHSSGWGWNSVKTYIGTLGSVPEQNLRIPVLMGVEVSNLSDSWGDARSGGRSHEGIDILAPKGTPIVSPTKAVVSSVGWGANGGNYVYTINAGGERFYFAHLDAYAPGISSGKVLEPGDVIGYVGNTGNASGGPDHLHFGIYSGGAQNPYPRITLAFTNEERMAALNKLAESDTEKAKTLAVKYKTFITSAQSKGLNVVQTLLGETGGGTLASAASAISYGGFTLTRDLTLGSTGEDVRALQKFLNSQGVTVSPSGAGSPGNETSYFGPATRKALATYQRMKGINPTSGYFGPITRGVIAKEMNVLIAVR